MYVYILNIKGGKPASYLLTQLKYNIDKETKPQKIREIVQSKTPNTHTARAK